jgi:hypothetical protein
MLPMNLSGSHHVCLAPLRSSACYDTDEHKRAMSGAYLCSWMTWQTDELCLSAPTKLNKLMNERLFPVLLHLFDHFFSLYKHEPNYTLGRQCYMFEKHK